MFVLTLWYGCCVDEWTEERTSKHWLVDGDGMILSLEMFLTVMPLNPGGTEKCKNSAFGKFHDYNSEFSVCLRSSVEDGVTQLLEENGNMIVMTKEVLFEGFHLVRPGSVTDSSLHWLIKRGGKRKFSKVLDGTF